MPTNNHGVTLVDFTPQVQQLNKPSRVRITIDKSNFHRSKAAPYKSLPFLFRPALEKVADYVRTEIIRETFDKEGPGWAPLARRTRREREWKGYGSAHPILKRTGDLYKELTDKSHPKHIEIIRTGKNARIEIGGSSVKFLENQAGKSSAHLPKRNMLPTHGRLDTRHRKALEQIVSRAIKQRMK